MQIEIGMRVKISTCCKQYGGKYSGELGTIEQGNYVCDESGKIGIRLDNYTNNRSSFGLFWFTRSEIEIEECEDEEMFGEYRTAKVSFLNDNGNERVCASKYALYDDFEVGDVVVVMTGHHGLAIAKIVSIDDFVSRVTNNREIVAKVDMNTYKDRVEARKRVAQLKTAMDARINKLQRMAVLEMFSEKDPEMKILLDEYKALTEQKGEVQKDGE